MFTKINVVDKFGQAISAIDPSPHHYNTPIATISPCLSDTYFPGTIGDTDPSLPTSRANTVIPQTDNNACPFVQLPPAINQPARLNASFVRNKNGAWKPCTEWDVRSFCHTKQALWKSLTNRRILSGAGS